MVFLIFSLVSLLLTGCTYSQSDIVKQEVKKHYLYGGDKIKDNYTKVYHMTQAKYLQKERTNLKKTTLCLALSKDTHYCRIFYFDNKVKDDIEKYIATYKHQIKALIIDLRHNKGGSFDEAIALSDLFLNEETILKTYRKDKTATTYKTRTQKSDVTDIPLILLVDGKTASAAEIFAASLQSKKRAVIVGEKSFGKNTVQELVPISSNSVLKLTVEEYEIIGYKRPFNGIIPDIGIFNNKVQIINKKWKNIQCMQNKRGDMVLNIGFCMAKILHK